MLTSTRRWLRQRQTRTNVAIGAGILGVGYVAGQYIVLKIGEARERMINERTAKENLRRRFNQNQEDCTITVNELLPTLAEQVFKALPCESITEELRQKRTDKLGRSSDNSDRAASEISAPAQSGTDEDVKSFASDNYVRASQMTTSSASIGEQSQPRTKLQLWNELKIKSITRAFTLIYSASLLTLLTRIQLNLLGRRNYTASLISSTSLSTQQHGISLDDADGASRAQGLDFEVNRQYLTFSWWLLHKGWEEIMLTVEAAVSMVIGSLKPTEVVSVDQLSSLVVDIRRKVEGMDTEDRRARSWLSCLLPPPEQEFQVLNESGIADAPLNAGRDTSNLEAESTVHRDGDSTDRQPRLRRLLDETADVIESPMFNGTLTRLLDAAFSHLVDEKIRAEAYQLPPLRNTSLNVASWNVNGDSVSSVKLATLLAIASREAHRIGGGLPNGYLEAIENVSALEAFASVIYSSNFESPSDYIDIEPSDTESLPDERPFDCHQSTEDNSSPSLVSKAANAIDTIWSGFGSAWSKVAD